jgi:gas vesicle protein
MSENHSASSTILAFLIGGLTGAALATLYAPRSGRETRDLLGERIREGTERSRETREKVVGRGRELVDEAAGYVEKQKGQLGRQRERLAAAVEAGRHAFQEEKEKGQA